MKVEGRRMYHRIVVGTDGSATADRAVDAAGGIARLTGGSVHVVTAYRPVRAAEDLVEQAAERLKARGWWRCRWPGSATRHVSGESVTRSTPLIKDR